jgi:hypothetical protein
VTEYIGQLRPTRTTIKGLWRFESDLLDSSGNSHTFSPGNSPTYVNGKFGRGLNLASASKQYVTQANHADFNPGTGDFTVGAWFKPTTLGNYGGILSKIIGDSDGWRLVYVNSNRIEFSVADTTIYSAIATVSFTTEWNRVIATRDSSSQKVYMNGVLVGNTSLVAKNADSTSVLTCGPYRSNDLTANMMDGTLDDVFFEKGRAWTASEILKDYALAVGKYQ